MSIAGTIKPLIPPCLWSAGRAVLGHPEQEFEELDARWCLDSDACIARAITDAIVGPFLDIGGRNGRHRALAQWRAYDVLDLAPSGAADQLIQADITTWTPTPRYGVVFSTDLLEHVADPISAVERMVGACVPGGTIICRTLFAWPYHPRPRDLWRFTHDGLRTLFERAGAVTQICGYDVRQRWRMKGTAYFQEHWKVLWIGRHVPSD